MKILYVITGLGLGGAERVVVNLAEQMYQRGHRVKIAYLTGEVVLKPQYKEIELVSLRLHSVKDIVGAFFLYKSLLVGFQPDVVHSHMVHANIFTRIARMFQFVPRLISTAHSNNEGGVFRMLAYRLTHHLADITTNVSRQAVLEFEKKGAVPKNSMLVVYNGVNTEKFNKKEIDKKKVLSLLRLDLNKKVILAVGRLTEAKNYPNLLQAISLLNRKDNFNAQLVIVGDGELRGKIDNLVRILNLSQDVKLLGNRTDISELINIADIYVLSSKFEGLPTVLLEAMACEKFVVATDCGGSVEILGDTGILVPSQNSVALAEAIDKALSISAEEVFENGKRARQYIEKQFSLEKSVNNWLELYEAK